MDVINSDKYGKKFRQNKALTTEPVPVKICFGANLQTKLSMLLLHVPHPLPASMGQSDGDRSWNIFYGHSLPSVDSRRAVVSFW